MEQDVRDKLIALVEEGRNLLSHYDDTVGEAGEISEGSLWNLEHEADQLLTLLSMIKDEIREGCLAEWSEMKCDEGDFYER